jgi:hypothetical protein
MKSNKVLGRALIMGMALVSVCAASVWGQTHDAEAKAAAELAAKLGGKGKTAVDGATVTLTGEAELKSALTVPAGVTLDLTATEAALRLKNSAKLTVDGTVNATGYGDNCEGSRLRLDGGKTLINGSGTISLKSKGCLLNVRGKCRLTLDGVTLVGIADNDSPLLLVFDGGELLMKSGVITGNTSIAEYANGGGVGVWSDGVFTMSGGVISGNTVVSGEYARGGGVVVQYAVFTMKGGTIAGNTTIAADTSFGGGGGVCVDESTFTLQGGTIYGSDAAAKAGGTANETKNSKGVSVSSGAALSVVRGVITKWGTGGKYTKGGVPQTGGSAIATTDETLIAIPKR